jgi:hypothetical protein
MVQHHFHVLTASDHPLSPMIQSNIYLTTVHAKGPYVLGVTERDVLP